MEMDYIVNLANTATAAGCVVLFLIIVAKPLVPILKDWLKGKLLNREIILNESNHYTEVVDELQMINTELKQMNQKLETVSSNILIIKDRTGRDK